MTEENDREIKNLLEKINQELVLQNSLRRMFFIGIVYGIGFFTGSAVIATIALGFFGPWFSQIPWIHDAFVTGASLVR